MSMSYFCHKVMTLEINYRIKNGEKHKPMETILKSQWDNEEIKGDIKKKTLILWKRKHNTLKSEIQEKQFCVQTYSGNKKNFR